VQKIRRRRKANMQLVSLNDKTHTFMDIPKVVRNAIEALPTLCHTFYGWLQIKRVIVGTVPARSVRRMEMKKHKTQSRLRHQSRRKLKLNYL